jgi:hypothetical protein
MKAFAHADAAEQQDDPGEHQQGQFLAPGERVAQRKAEEDLDAEAHDHHHGHGGRGDDGELAQPAAEAIEAVHHRHTFGACRGA